MVGRPAFVYYYLSFFGRCDDDDRGDEGRRGSGLENFRQMAARSAPSGGRPSSSFKVIAEPSIDQLDQRRRIVIDGTFQ